MPGLTDYLIKVNIALFLFYLAYHFGLRKLTFYRLNRHFLLFGMLFSSLYPFLELSGMFRTPVVPVMGDSLLVVMPEWGSMAEGSSHVAAFDYRQLLLPLFWLGVSFMAIRFGMQLLSLYRLHRNSIPARINDYRFRQLSEQVSPFSFWQTIYLNPGEHSAAELEAILRHEQIHVKEWHSLDVLLAKLNLIFYWFNPGLWLMQRAVVENLEFITDRKMLETGIDHQAYQYSLLRMSSGFHSPALANKFSFKTLKKRIRMMNQKQSSKLQISRYALLLPVLVVLLFCFSASDARNVAIFPTEADDQSGASTIITKDGILRYVIDPNTFDDHDFREMRKIFHEAGYLLELYKDYSGPELTEVKVTIKSAKGSASATYRVHKLQELDYIILITANPETDEISVLSQAKE